ncbi:MAG: lysophospholipid acyltransferase family protein [Verrucomicrobiota bacterium]|nr:lysophospholipid acyltransferase family protein [Verrucomicrobiota bacterium]
MSQVPQSRAVSGIVSPHHLNWKQRLIARIAYGIARGIMMTWRLKISDAKVPAKGEGPFIYCLWHNRLAMAPRGADYVRSKRGGEQIYALISASKDGGWLAALVEMFGLKPIRGSSSRRGRQALLELTGVIRSGHSVAITPDGPRGPRYEIQDGVVALAQLTGKPIVPIAFNIRGKFELSSWDRFQIPYPFAICEAFFKEPIHVPRELTGENRAILKEQIKQAMLHNG